LAAHPIALEKIVRERSTQRAAQVLSALGPIETTAKERTAATFERAHVHAVVLEPAPSRRGERERLLLTPQQPSLEQRVGDGDAQPARHVVVAHARARE